jgi:hypothetical protein
MGVNHCLTKVRVRLENEVRDPILGFEWQIILPVAMDDWVAWPTLSPDSNGLARL